MTARDAVARGGLAAARGTRWTGRLLRGEFIKRVGGPARARVIALFGAVLALNGADTATVGAVAPQLEHALHIGNTKIGLLSSVALLVGAVFTIPVGLLVDRIKRMPILSLSIVLWSVASLLSAFAGSYSGLLLTRLALGAVTATAGPAIASLTGDYFPARERGRVYAYILGGEIAGTAVGFIVSEQRGEPDRLAGGVRAAGDPRASSWPASCTGPCPSRCGAARAGWSPGSMDLAGGGRRGRLQQLPPEPDRGRATAAGRRPGARGGAALGARARSEAGARARTRAALSLIASVTLHPLDPDQRADDHQLVARLLLLLGAARRSRCCSSAGTTTPARRRPSWCWRCWSRARWSGTLVSGRVTDAMVRARVTSRRRVWVPAMCYLGAAALLIPGILGSHLTPALWFDVAGAALLSAANPPLDAARLDIMPAGLWGRAESTRTVLRSLAQALAPLVFGGLSQLIAGIAPAQAPIGTHPGVISPSTARGLEISFLLLLEHARGRRSVPAAGAVDVSHRRGHRRRLKPGLARSTGGPGWDRGSRAVSAYHRLTVPRRGPSE